jgi:hypothetical protein
MEFLLEFENWLTRNNGDRSDLRDTRNVSTGWFEIDRTEDHPLLTFGGLYALT